jgi:hypothetical protein
MFYRERSKAGDYIILDNSAVEKKGRSVPVRDVVTAAILTRPTVVVLPDFLFDGERTYDEMINALRSPGIKFLKRVHPDVKIAAVAQGIDDEEWIESFHVLNGVEGIDLIGIPKVTGHTFGARWKVLERIAKYVEKPCHLLGFWHQSSLEDLKHEATFPFVVGIDTPKPIRLAAAGKTLDGWGTLEHDRSFLDRAHPIPMDLGLLRENCARFVEICNGHQSNDIGRFETSSNSAVS